jgi:hypothetical protein
MTAQAADCAAGGGAPVAGGGPRIIPETGLSTDYLNHFTEAIMLLEMIAGAPECAADLRAWRPKNYCQHFAASRFRNRNDVIAAYGSAEPAAVEALERAAETFDAVLLQARAVVLAHLGTPAGEALARQAVTRLRPLVARAAVAINGGSASADDGRSAQAEIDAMFAP